jgi:hypothetical protein
VKCKEVSQLLMDYNEGLLDGDRKRLLQAHLLDCAKCQKDLEEIKATFGLLSRGKISEPSESFWINFLPEVRQRIEKGKLRKPVRIFKSKLAFGFLSGLVVLIIGITLFLRDYRVKPESQFTILDYSLPSSYASYATYDKLSELLAFYEDQEVIRNSLFPEEENGLVLLGEAAEEEYWSKKDLEMIFSELSIDELKMLAEKIEKTNI